MVGKTLIKDQHSSYSKHINHGNHGSQWQCRDPTGLCSLCWLYEYVKLTPNFAGAACAASSSASSAFALRETDEGEAMAWHNGWSQRLPDVMDGAMVGGSKQGNKHVET